MFTIKYRYYQLSDQQPPEDCLAPTKFWQEHEQLHGPYIGINKIMVNGYQMVECFDYTNPPNTFGPYDHLEEGQPRPVIWVMNEQGATIAKYDL